MAARRYRIDPSARLDLHEATDYYAGNAPGTEERFLAAIAEAIEHAMAFPGTGTAAPEVGPDARRYPVSTFPYALLGVLEGDELVIIAVAHHSRNPARWKRLR